MFPRATGPKLDFAQRWKEGKQKSKYHIAGRALVGKQGEHSISSGNKSLTALALGEQNFKASESLCRKRRLSQFRLSMVKRLTVWGGSKIEDAEKEVTRGW